MAVSGRYAGGMNRAERLRWLEEILAGAVLEVEAKDVARVSSELRAVMVELDGMPTAVVSTSDDLVARRAARRSASTDSASAAGDHVVER